MTNWIGHVLDQLGYLGVALLMFLETVFPPVPSEAIMSIAGLRAAEGELGLGGVIAAGTAGAMAGNLIWYAAARALGLDRFRPLVDRHGRWLTLDWREVEKGERLFLRHDWLFVCVARMVPTIRSLVSIPAGLARMDLARFLLWSTLGTLGWTAALAWGGYHLGSRFERMEEWLGPISTGVIVAILAWYLIRVATWTRSR